MRNKILPLILFALALFGIALLLSVKWVPEVWDGNRKLASGLSYLLFT